MSNETSSVLLDEERRLAAHQEVKGAIDDGVKTQIKSELARVEPAESSELASVATELKRKSAHEAVETGRELERGRTAARVSQLSDYIFYLIYGLISLQFLLRLLGARPGSGFVRFISGITLPLLAPFERIVPTLSSGSNRVELSYLLALVVFILLHLAINGVFRLIAHRKVTV
jgi:uncharacterized protein YggT (Ycf19 family)